jgi:perosamine synthetase
LKDKKERDNLMDYLFKNGVDSRKIFYAVHEMPLYNKYSHGNYPESISVSEKGLSLPSSVKLKDEEIEYISKLIINFLK